MHKKVPFYKLSRSKAPKHGKFRVKGIQNKPVSIFLYHTGFDFSSSNNFANIGWCSNEDIHPLDKTYLHQTTHVDKIKQSKYWH